MAHRPLVEDRAGRAAVAVSDYVRYRQQGYLVCRQLVSSDEIEGLLAHAMDLLEGRRELPGVPPIDRNAPLDEQLRRVTRLHMLHRQDPLFERFLLYPQVLDVVQALVGPDILALQTMLFYNPPGTGGQGWHQDAYYIPTFPETLIGAWIALDAADEQNGCLWVVPGSNNEPIYPDAQRGSVIHGDGVFSDLEPVENVSHLDDEVNTLSAVVRKYPPPVPVPVDAGDVVFFDSHLLHRSHPNRTQERWRRAFVNHYCNARSWVPWNHGQPFEGDAANAQHILARGSTHLPFATPQFGSPCAALAPPPVG